MDVGERLKAIRKLKGISQRELAKRVGVTNSTISMIEKRCQSVREFAEEGAERHSDFYR
ncbi:helix-turn-helix domain-containing protein [Aliamphritea spongicola]